MLKLLLESLNNGLLLLVIIKLDCILSCIAVKYICGDNWRNSCFFVIVRELSLDFFYRVNLYLNIYLAGDYMINIVEQLRKEAVNQLFTLNSLTNSWNTWAHEINNKFAPLRTNVQILNLGDHLYDIFNSTNNESGRAQNIVAGGGAAWESLVCWYLNLCSIGRRTIVIKQNKKLIPDPISDAITVNYSNFASNTESDLIALTFPDRKEFSDDISLINAKDEKGRLIPISIRGKYNTKKLLNALVTKYFTEIEIHIIQCKTNWNDNAQIPMLWDMITHPL